MTSPIWILPRELSESATCQPCGPLRVFAFARRSARDFTPSGRASRPSIFSVKFEE
ncbi:MAG: hypothetical protein R3A52_06360 [Polyangiales bacterium]